eukprot:scpid77497/ scgid31692/ 
MNTNRPGKCDTTTWCGFHEAGELEPASKSTLGQARWRRNADKNKTALSASMLSISNIVCPGGFSGSARSSSVRRMTDMYTWTGTHKLSKTVSWEAEAMVRQQ